MSNELKPCPFCHEDRDGYVSMFGSFFLSKNIILGWRLHSRKCDPVHIRYCPMCGRDLLKEV